MLSHEHKLHKRANCTNQRGLNTSCASHQLPDMSINKCMTSFASKTAIWSRKTLGHPTTVFAGPLDERA